MKGVKNLHCKAFKADINTAFRTMSSTQSDVTCFPSAQTVTRFPQASINQLTAIVGVTHCCLPSLQHRQNLHIPLYCCTVSNHFQCSSYTDYYSKELFIIFCYWLVFLFSDSKTKPVLVTSYILGVV